MLPSRCLCGWFFDSAPGLWGQGVEGSEEAGGGEGLVEAAGLGLGPQGDRIGTGQELQGRGAFGGKNIYPGTSALSLLLGGSEEIMSTAAGSHLRLGCLCFLYPQTPGKCLSGCRGTGKRSELS